MMTKEEIGRIIKGSRIAAGLTQLQVGNALNRPQTTIAAWEAGRSQPDANTLFELFSVLGRSVDEAFGFTGNDPPLSSEALKVARDFDNLSSYGKRHVQMEIERQQMRERCLYDNLKILRAKRNMTQQKLADKSGISLERIQQLESEDGIKRLDDLVRREEIAKIAEVLETEPRPLIGVDTTYETTKRALEHAEAYSKAVAPTSAAPKSPSASPEGTDTTPVSNGPQRP